MGNVEKEMEELQRKLAAKTREIEMLVAAEQNLGDLASMESTEYARLRIYVEELIYKWQEANVRPSTSNPDTAINRLIAEREEIEFSLWKCDKEEESSGSGKPTQVPGSPVHLQTTHRPNGLASSLFGRHPLFFSSVERVARCTV
jgi:hypothetical protein